MINPMRLLVLAIGAAYIAVPTLMAAETSSATPTSSATRSESVTTKLRPGDKAPEFTRLSADGKKVSLRAFRGKPVILYFYPKDETPNCVKEACGFRDFYAPLRDKGAEIIGVSGDTDESHRAFAAHRSLPFPLISDTDNSLLKLYDVPFFKNSLHRRVTFVINKRGIITNIVQYTNDGDEHVQEALSALKHIDSRFAH
jgi:thioredoxin-dependent peroxiredoxin